MYSRLVPLKALPPRRPLLLSTTKQVVVLSDDPRYNRNDKLTQCVFGPELVEAAELIITIQDGGASDDGHQDHVGGIELALLICVATAAVRAPAPSGARLSVPGHCTVATRITALAAVDLHGLQIVCRLEHHAQRERDHGHDHLPGVRGTELAVRPKELSRHGRRIWYNLNVNCLPPLRWSSHDWRGTFCARLLEGAEKQ